MGSASTAAKNRYNAKAYKRVNTTIKVDEWPAIQSHAKSTGESINAFILRAIRETMQRDKG